MADIFLTQTGEEVQADLDTVENLEDVFSTSKTYSAGDLCIYNSELWRCTTDILSPGAWTGSSNWVKVKLGDLQGLENPMTTAGDMIVGGTSGTPERIGKGTAGQVLTMNAGGTAPEWASTALHFGMIGESVDTSCVLFVIGDLAEAGYMETKIYGYRGGANRWVENYTLDFANDSNSIRFLWDRSWSDGFHKYAFPYQYAIRSMTNGIARLSTPADGIPHDSPFGGSYMVIDSGSSPVVGVVFFPETGDFG